MHQAELPVGFDELVVALGRVTDQLVCADQTAEAVPVHGAGSHPFSLIDQQDRTRRPFPLQQLSQMVQQFVVRKLATALDE